MNPKPLHAITRRRCLGAIARLGLGAAGAVGAVGALGAGRARHDALPMMLATDAGDDIDPVGWLVSEKFDGVRALWDGQALRLRGGAGVAAPPWFTARLPLRPLDGELWLGRGAFEALAGAVRRAHPDAAEWRALRYQVFDLPGAPGRYAERAAQIEALARASANSAFLAVAQQRLADRMALRRRLDEVVQAGGEGLVLHRADALWQPGRSPALRKLKPLHDAEALVLGHIAGRGRLAGRLGALRVRLADGTEFSLGTGFSDAERAAPPAPGSVVTFTYRGRTAAGVPRFASFLRRHPI
ncbi:MAG: DNA ligase [Burkholderiales bacterium]|nr:DNA ligase [Burkholderiales bacterium]